jgi:hypothetical protein
LSAYVSIGNICYCILLLPIQVIWTTALNASATPSDDSWIIDSGASDHMTGIFSLFSSYNLCSSREKVRIANGSLSSVSGKGSISITPSMSLSSVLHIPDFAANYCPLLVLPVS